MSLSDPNPNSGRAVHQILAQGYLVYLAAIVIGFAISYFWPDSVSIPLEAPLGMLLIVLGTLLIYWAQSASGRTAPLRNAGQDIEPHHFCVGPYKYSRSPTQYGLFLMALGLALIYGSLYMVITTIAALLIGKFWIIREEEKHLAAKYGQAYLDYQKEVRF